MSRDEERKAFDRAMRGVEPLGERDRRVAARRPRSRPTGVGSSVELDVDRWGEYHQGTVPGTDPEVLRQLERGEVMPDLQVDLHGLGAEEARALVRERLRAALKGGLACVRFVHGRGRRSAAGPVLKRRLPAWLAEPPHGRRLVAFTSAGELGASGGATLVLLRPSRSAGRDRGA